MAKIIEARAVISAVDKTGAVFDKVAKKIEQIAKTGKAAAAVDRIAKSLESAKAQMAAIDRYASAQSGFEKARQRFLETEKAVKAASQAVRRGEGDAQKLAQEYERTQAAVSRAAQAFERQKSAVLSAKRSLDELGIPAGRIVATQNSIRAAVERTNAALERQPGRIARAAGAAGRGLGFVGPFAGPAILRGTKAAAHAGAEVQSEIVKMRAAGIPESEIQAADRQLSDLMPKYTNVSRATMLERYKELRSVLAHPEETPHLIEPVIKANAAMNAVDRSGHLAEGLGFALKSSEVLGLANDPKRFTSYLDAFVKAQQVMGKTITPEAMYDLATNFKSSAAVLSDRFLTTTGISLAQEMRGNRAGTGIDAMVKTLIGGYQGNHAAAKSMLSIGLVGKDDFEKTKTGDIKGLKAGRHVKGYELAMSDPDRWLYEYYLPALTKHGITDQNEVLAHIRRDFPTSRAADVVAKMITQRQAFENHGKLYGQAQGLDAIGNNQNDPFVALSSLSTSIENFASTLTSPSMQLAAGMMSSLGTSIGSWSASLSEFQKSHPDLAKWAGGGALAAGAGVGGMLTWNLASGLMNGFGLKTSAAALDGSAAALMGAATALKGGSAADIASDLAGGKAKPKGRMPIVPLVSTLTLPMFLGGDTLQEQEGLMKDRVDEQTKAWRKGRDFTLGSNRSFLNTGSPSSFERISSNSIFAGGTSQVSQFKYSEVPTVKAEVSGQVTGETTIHVKIEAPEVLRATTEAKEAVARLNGQLSTNRPGSTGRSSPDAGAAGQSGGW